MQDGEGVDERAEFRRGAWAARSASAGGLPVRPGEHLENRFEIEQPIASGAMGTVFRARDPSSGEAVAVKVISGEPGQVTGRFAREVKVLAELSHPGIVRYISHGTTPSGELFLVMEWL
jgi:serine/threonine protein kinase